MVIILSSLKWTKRNNSWKLISGVQSHYSMVYVTRAANLSSWQKQNFCAYLSNSPYAWEDLLRANRPANFALLIKNKCGVCIENFQQQKLFRFLNQDTKNVEGLFVHENSENICELLQAQL